MAHVRAPAFARRRHVVRAVCVLLAMVIGSPAAAEVIERLLAVVAGHLIMASDVAAVRQLGLVPADETDREVLDRLIDRALILAEVERYAPPEPSESAITADLARLRARFADAAAYASALETLGLDESRVRERLRQSLRIEAYLEQRFVVAVPTVEEIEVAYRATPGRYAAAGAFDEARPLVQRDLLAERRAPRVEEWVAGLRRRSRIVILIDREPGAPLSE